MITPSRCNLRWIALGCLALGFETGACVHDPTASLRDAAAQASASQRGVATPADAQPFPTGPQVRLYATTRDAHDLLLHWEWSAQGWRLARLPFDVFRTSTPSQALRALVWAVALERWDVVVSLAPARFRQGLSEQSVARQWTTQPSASGLREGLRELVAAGDRLPMSDGYVAHLDLPSGRSVVLEREGEHWVVASL